MRTEKWVAKTELGKAQQKADLPIDTNSPPKDEPSAPLEDVTLTAAAR
jgi:hypothetical protein